jgi:hypothetical protein
MLDEKIVGIKPSTLSTPPPQLTHLENPSGAFS